jgi:hypothetical protein
MYPDPKLDGKWDPDPKKIVSDPQHCFKKYIILFLPGVCMLGA